MIPEPLRRDHHDGLVAAAQDGELWELWYTSVPAPEGMAAEIHRRLAMQEQGSMLPFTTRLIDPATGGPGRIIGMTTYMTERAGAQARQAPVGAWRACWVQFSADCYRASWAGFTAPRSADE